VVYSRSCVCSSWANLRARKHNDFQTPGHQVAKHGDPNSRVLTTQQPVLASEISEKTQADTTSQGPSMGPSMPSQEQSSILDQLSSTQLPDSVAREIIRNLTMPPIPNFDIPVSPPGSPPLGATKKFEHFLKLKKQGVHFNSKLETSSALRNPALLQKLMAFANIDDYDQYACALPPDLGVPTSYPPWAYGNELNKTQQQLTKKKEEQKANTPRDKLDFVPGSISRPVARSNSNNRGTKRRAL